MAVASFAGAVPGLMPTARWEGWLRELNERVTLDNATLNEMVKLPEDWKRRLLNTSVVGVDELTGDLLGLVNHLMRLAEAIAGAVAQARAEIRAIEDKHDKIIIPELDGIKAKLDKLESKLDWMKNMLTDIKNEVKAIEEKLEYPYPITGLPTQPKNVGEAVIHIYTLLYRDIRPKLFSIKEEMATIEGKLDSLAYELGLFKSETITRLDSMEKTLSKVSDKLDKVIKNLEELKSPDVLGKLLELTEQIPLVGKIAKVARLAIDVCRSSVGGSVSYYVLVSLEGVRVNATNLYVDIPQILGETFIVEVVATGLYLLTIETPPNTPPGEYVVIFEASYTISINGHEHTYWATTIQTIYI